MKAKGMLALGVASFAIGCGGADTEGPRTGADAVRDTTIVHEECDGSSSSARSTDVNRDGSMDLVQVMEGGNEICRIVDLNLDGNIDTYVYFDANGQVRRRESDFDRDGRPDEISIYESGALVRKELETNFDMKLDTWDFYAGGRLARRERDSDGDGVIDQWWEFNRPDDPRCATVASDKDADGQPDPNQVIDLCGESYGAFGQTVIPNVQGAAPPSPGAPLPPPAKDDDPDIEETSGPAADEATGSEDTAEADDSDNAEDAP